MVRDCAGFLCFILAEFGNEVRMYTSKRLTTTFKDLLSLMIYKGKRRTKEIPGSVGEGRAEGKRDKSEKGKGERALADA